MRRRKKRKRKEEKQELPLSLSLTTISLYLWFGMEGGLLHFAFLPYLCLCFADFGMHAHMGTCRLSCSLPSLLSLHAHSIISVCYWWAGILGGVSGVPTTPLPLGSTFSKRLTLPGGGISNFFFTFTMTVAAALSYSLSQFFTCLPFLTHHRTHQLFPLRHCNSVSMKRTTQLLFLISSLPWENGGSLSF